MPPEGRSDERMLRRKLLISIEKILLARVTDRCCVHRLRRLGQIPDARHAFELGRYADRPYSAQND